MDQHYTRVWILISLLHTRHHQNVNLCTRMCNCLTNRSSYQDFSRRLYAGDLSSYDNRYCWLGGRKVLHHPLLVRQFSEICVIPSSGHPWKLLTNTIAAPVGPIHNVMFHAKGFQELQIIYPESNTNVNQSNLAGGHSNMWRYKIIAECLSSSLE